MSLLCEIVKSAFLKIIFVSFGIALTIHFDGYDVLKKALCEKLDCKETMIEDNLIQNAYSQPDAKLVPSIEDYLAQGGDINYQSTHGENLLGVTFRLRKMSTFRYLVEKGANPASLGWPKGFMEIALNDTEDPNIFSNIDTTQRNEGGLTPFLFAVSLGHQTLAQKLLPLTTNEGRKDNRYGHGPIYYAAENKHGEMIDWLLSESFDVNEESSFGETALHIATEIEASEIVKQLIRSGANINARHNLSLQLKAFPPTYYPEILSGPETIFTPMNQVTAAKIATLLYRAGAPLKELSDNDVKRKIIGASNIPKQAITQSDFQAYKHRKFGKSNPEVTNHSFWLEQIRTHADGYVSFEKYSQSKRNYSHPATWSFNRFGQSATELPDGRWVLIAGEHEDSYDPDFCIYNDVVVISPSGEASIYSYPESVFQPTDFHTSTLIGETILIVGNLGYHGKRSEGVTPVYSLDLKTFKISNIQTQGEGPGWISDHDAKLDKDTVVISGGRVWKDANLVPNDEFWELSLSDYSWKKRN